MTKKQVPDSKKENCVHLWYLCCYTFKPGLPLNGSKVVILVIFRSDPSETSAGPVGISFAFQDGKTFNHLSRLNHWYTENMWIILWQYEHSYKYTFLCRTPKSPKADKKCKNLIYHLIERKDFLKIDTFIKVSLGVNSSVEISVETTGLAGHVDVVANTTNNLTKWANLVFFLTKFKSFLCHVNMWT